MTPIRNAATISAVVGALLATVALADTASAQAPAGSSAVVPLAVGLVSSGVAEAQAIEATREGDILTVKLRFKPLVANKVEVLYSSISKSDYENGIYVLAGNKKYLLLTDSNNQPLASPRVVLSTSNNSPSAGTWYGRFPAPPKNVTKVSLAIPGVEALDGIKITDR